jgi:hypothetical protein
MLFSVCIIYETAIAFMCFANKHIIIIIIIINNKKIYIWNMHIKDQWFQRRSLKCKQWRHMTTDTNYNNTSRDLMSQVRIIETN